MVSAKKLGKVYGADPEPNTLGSEITIKALCCYQRWSQPHDG